MINDQIVKLRDDIWVWIQKEKKYTFTIMQHNGYELTESERIFLNKLEESINKLLKE